MPKMEKEGRYLTLLSRREGCDASLDFFNAHRAQNTAGSVQFKPNAFYVVDADDRLAGVLPTRRLLTAPLEQQLSEVMISRVVAIPRTASVLEACEAFVLHKFLAFPVVTSVGGSTQSSCPSRVCLQFPHLRRLSSRIISTVPGCDAGKRFVSNRAANSRFWRRYSFIQCRLAA